ncbi:hypothetical protein [Listeria seeligeri]|uniref:hypothetical protein n=2 Tax=Listeria seeligeri TaxID=1640 RepID=UPI0016292F5A|nr:hypothetical protein [Listeria seeligeri]MBC1886623.1 hypothetical protein [Listeria seeligeri]
MRTDIDIHYGENNILYIKYKENIYQFTGININCAKKAWNEITNGNLEIKDGEVEKAKLIEFLKSIGIFEVNNSMYSILKKEGLNINSNNKSNEFIVGLVGDEDLVSYYMNSYPSDYKLVELNNNLEEIYYDYAIIITRKFNRKMQKNLNRNLYHMNKPYCSILVEEMNFSVGPQTIPTITSCLNCKNIHETDNNYYGNITTLFDDSDTESREFIPKKLLNLCISFTEAQVLKYQLQLNEGALESEIAQVAVEYSFLEGYWEERNIIKSPKCEVCFSKSVDTEQVFEVSLQ